MTTEAPLQAPTNFTQYELQSQSPLFSLPAELRYEIFARALVSAPDTTRPIDQDAYCTRPGYETIPHTYTELLRTCRRIYMEAWFMPFVLSEHAFYMGSPERAPARNMSVSTMQRCLNLIHDNHGKVEGGAVRIFPQLFALEATSDCDGVLTMKHFYPKTITITIRHTDTWWWEENYPLHVNGTWGGRISLPSSVTQLKIDLESLERRKNEVDKLVGDFARLWSFRREDGVRMDANEESISIDRWTGSSTFGGVRWLRDESRPGELDYYVATVTWRPSTNPPDNEGLSNPSVEFNGPQVEPVELPLKYVSVRWLERVGVPDNATAEDTIRMIQEYRERASNSDNDDSILDSDSSDSDEDSEEDESEEDDSEGDGSEDDVSENEDSDDDNSDEELNQNSMQNSNIAQ